MFYTRTCHFPLFAAAVGRWLFAISTLRCTLYHLQVLHYISSEGVRWFAPICDVRARQHDATFVIWISRSSVLHYYMYYYAHAYVGRPTANMYVCIGNICTHDVHAEMARGMPSINSTIIKIEWINAIGSIATVYIVEYWYRYVIMAFAMYATVIRETSLLERAG